ncbi:MAG: GAF domain-containing sensor histidine kinase [Myxococcota bacterium]|nr:GAF domain-containing sensor histidine kinase [Myxococcales bacterium]
MSNRRTPAEDERLNRALRLTASQASSLSGGGAALVYTRFEDDPLTGRLRAAAGFRTADEARLRASELSEIVARVLQSGQSETAPPITEREASEPDAGALVLPCVARDEIIGALVVSPRTALTAEARETLDTLVWATANQLDHDGLARVYASLASESRRNLELADEKNDELLKLSEELFAQDIELLRNNEKLGKIEKLKNDFIEKMSRELRTPLNSIIEATITVLSSEMGNLSDASQSTLRKALDEGTAFQRTLQNILDLWRIKQDELPIEIQELSITDVIDETIFSVQETLGQKPVEILKEIPAPLPKVRGDLAKINQILFLLLDNAAKFTEQGTIKIGARFEDDRLHCWIEDTGIGICPDDQKYIWNEFYQVDDRASDRYRGAGLGLTLVHDLLALLDGDSMLQSEAGVGTRVEFSVPVSAA